MPGYFDRRNYPTKASYAMLPPAPKSCSSMDYVDGRSSGQWLDSVEEYLKFMAARGRRHSHTRFNPESDYYHAGLRELHCVRARVDAAQPSAQIQREIDAPTARDIHISALATHKRAWLVAQIRRYQPELQAKILSHLQRTKLAAMLIDLQGPPLAPCPVMPAVVPVPVAVGQECAA